MPELPEVETVRRDLELELVGRTIAILDPRGVRTFRRTADPLDAVARTAGRTVTAVDRRGKYLLLRLDSLDVVVIHLRMSGQLLVSDPGLALPRHTHATFTFSAGFQLRFVDPRTFGEIFVTAVGPNGVVPELAHLGPDPLDPSFNASVLRSLTSGRRTGVKALLLDQRVVAGIGNLYADEILWAARIRHSRRADRLTGPQVVRLHASMVTTLGAAIEKRGSSLADEQYRDLYGALGAYQHHHNVYARVGQPCPRCGGTIRRVKAAGRSTYFCPHCQS